MHRENQDVLQQLMDRVEEASQTAEAARRKNIHSPRASYNLETPLAEVKLFGWNIQRLFTETEYYLECMLRRKLWRWDHFPDSDEPIHTAVEAWLGHYPEYTFLGMEVNFDALGIPRIRADLPIKTAPQIRHLKPVDFKTSGWMPRVLRWWEDINEICGERIQVNWAMNWWRGCLDLAVELRGYEQFISDTGDRPEFVHDLMKFLVEQRCRWWEGFCQHFHLPKQPTDIGNDWINIPFISPRIFERFVLPRYLELEAFHGGIHSIHSCGNQWVAHPAPVQRYLLEIKSLANFEVSPWTSLEQSLSNIPPDRHWMVSLHPNDVLVAEAGEMRRKLENRTTALGGRNYDIGTSGLTPLSPDPEDIIAKIRVWTGIARQVLDPIRAGPEERAAVSLQPSQTSPRPSGGTPIRPARRG